MANRDINLDDANVIFNGDGRGRQYFLINTNSLTVISDMDIDDDKTSPYYKIRQVLKDDTEYIDFQKSFGRAMQVYDFNIRDKATAGNADANERYTKSITDLLADLSDDAKTKLSSWLENMTRHSYGGYNKLPNNADATGDLPVSTVITTSFDALDKYVATQLKDAWKTYKSTQPLPTIDRNPANFGTVAAPFVGEKDRIIKAGDKYYKVKIDGNMEELKLADNKKCDQYGVNGDNCEDVLYKCLVDGGSDKLASCITVLGGQTVDNDKLKNMHPEIVLALLHRFGFKAARDSDGVKKIVSVAFWKDNLVDKFGIDKSLVDPVEAYLSHLVSYVNNNPGILNPVRMNDFYDNDTKKDRYGRTIDATKTTKMPIEALTQFFESRRGRELEPKNPYNFMRDLYDRYGITVPTYLQNGGDMTVNMLKDSLDNGRSGYKYLKQVWDSLLASVNVTIDGDSLTQINKAFADLETVQNDLVKYFEFVGKVRDNYELFKHTPTKVKLTGADVVDLENTLKNVVKDYKDKEDKIAKLIEALAKAENKPDEINTAFD